MSTHAACPAFAHSVRNGNSPLPARKAKATNGNAFWGDRCRATLHSSDHPRNPGWFQEQFFRLAGEVFTGHPNASERQIPAMWSDLDRLPPDKRFNVPGKMLIAKSQQNQELYFLLLLAKTAS